MGDGRDGIGALGEPQRDEPGDRRAGRADDQRPGQPEQLDEDDPGGERAEDRPERVRRVEPTERAREVRVAGELAGQRGQRRAHEDRGRCQGQDRQREAEQRDRLERAFEGAVRAAVDLVQQPERERRRQDDDDQDELDDAVHPQRRPDAIGQPAAEEAPDRHAAEEAGQDRRDGLRRVTEDEDELPRPDDLVHEPGGAGQDEDREDEPGMSHRGSFACPAGCDDARPSARPIRRLSSAIGLRAGLDGSIERMPASRRSRFWRARTAVTRLAGPLAEMGSGQAARDRHAVLEGEGRQLDQHPAGERDGNRQDEGRQDERQEASLALRRPRRPRSPIGKA